MRHVLAGVILLVACGGPKAPEGTTLPPKKMSATDHEMAAMQHEREAEEHEHEADAHEKSDPSADERCFDEAVPSVTESGGEKIRLLRPCWTSLTSPRARELAQAEDHREKAAAHRKAARKLRDTEDEQCAGLGVAELSQSPFANRRDIQSVTALKDGATVVFTKVPGLTAAWMEKALECHYARAAVLGFPDKFMAYCPTTLPDVSIKVTETEDTVTVVVRSERSEIAAAVAGRAQDLRSEVVENAPSP